MRGRLDVNLHTFFDQTGGSYSNVSQEGRFASLLHSAVFPNLCFLGGYLRLSYRLCACLIFSIIFHCVTYRSAMSCYLYDKYPICIALLSGRRNRSRWDS
ncbi:hypothetical protein BT96DRAFT_302255 [Gymnopus androsaceus JB14]|uniref:Uncharacterized protein n=1 Tax=Gymnopus androsaceus JB14 TaxID=1447944 RepID=A0A6A4H2K7_9AGAR|nr:hypothetical protein BT96DRAFT_302255 [Gymnopus androsaceus JB14]